MNMDKKICDFVKDDEVQGYYLIKTANVKVSNGGKRYLDITLCDKTGEINAKLWDIQDLDPVRLTSGVVVKIRGNVLSWQSSLQFKIAKIRPVDENDQVSVSDLVMSAPIEAGDMMDELNLYVSKVKDDGIRKILEHFIRENSEKLLIYPAAKKNHHSIRSGLLYHIVRMLRMGEKLMEVYSGLNSDLLFSGIILHDMEKINEMDANQFGFVNEYTKEGQLLGHIIMGISKVKEVGTRLGVDEETLLMLQHMILTHHYEPEFGSPKKPMIPEAEMLHYLDIIDARVYDMEKVLKNTNSGEFSEGISSMGRRIMYKSHI